MSQYASYVTTILSSFPTAAERNKDDKLVMTPLGSVPATDMRAFFFSRHLKRNFLRPNNEKIL